jgi:hypothetical protein
LQNLSFRNIHYPNKSFLLPKKSILREIKTLANMKKNLLLLAAILFLTVSCSSDDDNTYYPAPTAPEASINGWWYRNANTATVSYKAYYFGEDGVFKQDMSNYGAGMGVGTWAWISDDMIKVTPTPGGGIAGGEMQGEVFKLTNDSLVMFTQQLRLCKTEPN